MEWKERAKCYLDSIHRLRKEINTLQEEIKVLKHENEKLIWEKKMPTIKIEDLNALSEEELIAYTTLLKAKKNTKPQTIEDEIERKTALEEPNGKIIESTIHKTAWDGDRMPVRQRFAELLTLLKMRGYLSTKDLKSIPQGSTLQKIRKLINKNNEILVQRVGKAIYFIYKDGKEEERLKGIIEGKSVTGLKQKYKKIRKTSTYHQMKGIRLKELLKTGMPFLEAQKVFNDEWQQSKEKYAANQFPDIMGVKKELKSILTSIIQNMVKTRGELKYTESSYSLGIDTVADWNDFLKDIYLKSSTICEIMGIENDFKIVGEGKNMMLVYQ